MSEQQVLPVTAESKLTRSQVKRFGPRPVEGRGKGATITAEVRFDDQCGNGHNTFTITGDIRGEFGQDLGGGCVHEEIAAVFPELAPYIKWHLSSTDGPMHYPGNALYHAGDKDCWGRRKGEPSTYDHGLRFDASPVTYRVKAKLFDFIRSNMEAGAKAWEVFGVPHESDPKTYGYHYSLRTERGQFGERWHEMAFRDETEANEVCAALKTCMVEYVRIPTQFSEGKERDLNAARSCAVWPEATDEELTAPDLREKLEARLPDLLTAFRTDVEALGFTW